jgi:hypothetical protein
MVTRAKRRVGSEEGVARNSRHGPRKMVERLVVSVPEMVASRDRTE